MKPKPTAKATARPPAGRRLRSQQQRAEGYGGNVWEWTNTCFLRMTLDGEAARHQHQLRRSRRAGRPPHLYDRLHPRSPHRRLRCRRAAGQSRLPARRRTFPIGRYVRRPERRKAAAASIDLPAIGGGLSQRKALPPLSPVIDQEAEGEKQMRSELAQSYRRTGCRATPAIPRPPIFRRRLAKRPIAVG